MKKVSIIVPVFNAQKYVERCVNSIIDQTYRDIEIILVDDGSTDESPAIIESYSFKDSRVKVVHKVNGGVSSARNVGIAAATGNYIQFVDSDDWLPPEATELLVNRMIDDSSDMSIGDFYRVVGNYQSHKGSIFKSGHITRREYADCMIKSPANLYFGVLWNKLYRRSIIQQNNIKMNENVTMSEDMIFNLEYLLNVSTVSVITEPVYYYSLSPGSLVIKNTTVRKTVQMKKNVFTYYNNFYRKILGQTEYNARIPAIYKYLIAISTDSFVLSNIISRKKKSYSYLRKKN